MENKPEEKPEYAEGMTDAQKFYARYAVAFNLVTSLEIISTNRPFAAFVSRDIIVLDGEGLRFNSETIEREDLVIQLADSKTLKELKDSLTYSLNSERQIKGLLG